MATLLSFQTSIRSPGAVQFGAGWLELQSLRPTGHSLCSSPATPALLSSHTFSTAGLLQQAFSVGH